MLLNDAISLTRQLVRTREKHPYYSRVCELRQKYLALITGENMDLLLKRFVRREDVESFEQRLALTISITPSVCSALMKPFNKVARNNKVKKIYDFKSPSRNDIVKQMREAFYGRQKSKNKGLDYWLNTRYPKLSFVDPNAWVVTEWSAPASRAEVIRPRPFEVSSDMAWHWEIINEETKWLWVHQCITYQKLVKEKNQKIADAIAAGVCTDEDGDKFTLYDEDYTLVYTQVDPNYLKSIGYKYAPNEELWKDEDTKTTYLVKTFEPNLGFVPAWRVGWAPDDITDGQTFVNGFHEAMPYLEKSIKTVSEMDLTMALHTFPQKMQYVEKCPGDKAKKKTCTMGKDTTGATCSICNGVGFKVHTSAQEALYFALPTDPEKNDILDLDKMLVYKHPPIDLLTFQKDYITSLKADCMFAVFSQTQLTKTTGTPDAPVTATEVVNNMQGVYDAIFPFTEKVSDIWIDEINTFGRLAGTPESVDPNIVCLFPANPQMKSLEELLQELKTANEAGAPSFYRDQINRDIAEIIYEGDDIAERMFKTKHQFFPFNGQTSDEIALNMASQYVSKFNKVLYANFDAIFNDIHMDDPGFWYYDLEKQWQILEEMVSAYMEEIDGEMNAPINLGTGGDGSGEPGTGGNNDPGNNDAGGGAGGKAEPKPGDEGYVDPENPE